MQRRDDITFISSKEKSLQKVRDALNHWNIVGSINEQDDSDSDAAPDDITFSSSKEKSLQKVRDALNQIGNEKERKRQKAESQKRTI